MTEVKSLDELTISDLSALLFTASDKETGEFNAMYDELEIANAKVAELEQRFYRDGEMLKKQEAVIHASVVVKQKDIATMNVLRAQNKELERLDGKRLIKQNAGYKKTIVELKEKLSSVEAQRKAALKNNKVIAQTAQTEGNAAFHYDPETQNAIRVIPSLYVGKNNAFDGIIGSPVIEFMCHARGITRQGMLLTDGTVGWADARNSKPSKDESTVAREFLLNWCKRNKIKS